MTDQPAYALPDLFIRPLFDDSKAAVTFTAPQGCARVAWAILDGGQIVQSGEAEAADGAFGFEGALPNFKSWSIDSPFLYELRLRFEDGAEVRQAFGMRKIHVTGDALFVNNRPFYARGHIRGREAHDHPNLEDLPLEAYYEKNIRAAKAYGFNLIRFHSRVPPTECFQAADRLGMFIHVEMRKYFGKYQKERAGMDDEGELLSSADWAHMVRRLRNHPSLLVYCMGNEIDHPGTNPRVVEVSRLTRELDPTRLFIDTCARGEFDRDNVDIDVQHMSYFYPFGRNANMFADTQNWRIFGSCKGLPVRDEDDEDDWTWRVTRAIPARRPILAHEVCHYVALRDLDALERKFERFCPDQTPWWLPELKKLAAAKGLEGQYEAMRQASRRFQFIGWKLGIEAARRSPLLAGFHFLQFSDTERYENSNGLVDCFDDPQGVDEKAFGQFNADTVILADLPRRTFFEGETIDAPVMLSHFDARIGGEGEFSFSLRSKAGGAVDISGSLGRIDLEQRGRQEICRLNLRLPRLATPEALVLTLRVTADQGETIENQWDLWAYPDRPADLPASACRVDLDEVSLAARYPQITGRDTAADARLLIVNRFTDEVLDHLAAGNDVLMLYRVPITRDRRERAAREALWLPATWDRFKGVIWDRGHNCGAFLRESAALAGFPTDGFMDLQFHGLVDDCDKVVLDDFPVPIEPIMEGVDKATRDRFDVYTYKLSELQSAYTMRRFGYIFEVRVGKGRLLVTGLNFTGIARREPEACALFESLYRYVLSDAFQPEAAVAPDALREYLERKAGEQPVKERRMTQYWQLDDEPLESRRYWAESMAYLDDEPLEPDQFLDKKKIAEAEDA